MLRKQQHQNRFNQFVNKQFARLESVYRGGLQRAMKLRLIAPVIIIACIAGSYFLMLQVPSQLAPKEDRGVLFAFVRAAEGTSYNRMAANMDLIQARLLPLLEQGVIKSFITEAPAFGGNAGDQTGFVILILEDWSERSVSASEALGLVNGALKNLPDVMVRALLPGFRGGSGDQIGFVLGGSDYSELQKYALLLRQHAEDDGMLVNGDIDYSEKTPELVVTLNKQRAAELGISLDDVSETLEVMLGGRTQTTFIERGEEYDVYLRGDENSFNNVSDLSQIYMRTPKGELITLDTIADVEEIASANRLSHYNKQKSITLGGSAAPGQSIGAVLDYLDAKAVQLLPSDINIYYSGESKEFKENRSSVMVVFALALLVAYLVLAAQFESFINPFVVMLTVPMGVFGGFIGMYLMSQGLNIYSQIGMIMLIGMVTKNGILIVEFANQLRDRGRSLEDAIIDASARRLRPILMTAFTTLAGAIPLILSTGAGSESRIAVGTVVFFGMAFATLVTLFVIPAMYRLISGNTHSPGYVAQQLENALLDKEKKILPTAD